MMQDQAGRVWGEVVTEWQTSVLEGTVEVILSNIPLSQKSQVQRAQHVVTQALPVP